MPPRFEPGREHTVNLRYWTQGTHSEMRRPDEIRDWQRSVVPGAVTFTPDRLRIAPSIPVQVRPGFAPAVQFEVRETETIPYDAVTAIRFAAHYVEVEFRDGGSPAAIAFTSAHAADRERLEWELALRLPAAMEAALYPESGPGPTRLGPTGTAPATTSPPSADHAMDDLGERMSGLGSALAPPPAAQRPPPRSGLGSGLFAAPPSDDDDA